MLNRWEMKPQEVPRLVLAIARTVRDSNQTREIHLTEEMTGRAHFRRLRARHFADGEGAELLRERPELCSDQVDYEALAALPVGTLGRAYSDHLTRWGLSADFQASDTQVMEDPELAYLVRRFRQTHDVWHALLELGVEGHEEVIVHAFSHGQIGLPVSALVMLFGTPKHFVLERRWRALRRSITHAWRAGRAASPLLPVHWEALWDQPLNQVRARYNVQPCTSL